jgi:hypothetical protein
VEDRTTTGGGSGWNHVADSEHGGLGRANQKKIISFRAHEIFRSRGTRSFHHAPCPLESFLQCSRAVGLWPLVADAPPVDAQNFCSSGTKSTAAHEERAERTGKLEISCGVSARRHDNIRNALRPALKDKCHRTIAKDTGNVGEFRGNPCLLRQCGEHGWKIGGEQIRGRRTVNDEQ